jgi:L-iditol 2-dehydrogenase
VIGTMRAAVYLGPGDVVVEDRPIPTPGADELLIEVDHCGVCGSDLHLMLEGWGRPGSIEGHEYAGRVVAIGPDVGGWSEGDRVVGGPARRCGSCRHCLAGRPSLCSDRDTPGTAPWQGAFARYKAIPASEAVRVPEGLSSRVAALAEPLAVALHGLVQGRVVPGQRVLVVGAGPIGALSVAALRAQGIDAVVVCEPSLARRELALALGAASVSVPEDLDVPSIAEPGRIVAEPFDVVLECSGKAKAMEAGLAQLERGGTLVLVGAGIEPPRFDPNRILLNELLVTGSYCYDAHGFERALDLLASGRVPGERVLEPQPVGLDGLLGAMQRQAAGAIPGKILVDPRIGATDG